MNEQLENPILDQASAWCLRLSEGGLAPEEQQAFQAWLDADPANAPAFDDAVQVWRALDEASLFPDLIELRRTALDNFRKANRTRWRADPQPPPPAYRRGRISAGRRRGGGRVVVDPAAAVPHRGG